MLPFGAHGLVLETAKSSGAWQYVCIRNVHASFGFGQQGFIDAARLERLAACDPARAFSGVGLGTASRRVRGSLPSSDGSNSMISYKKAMVFKHSLSILQVFSMKSDTFAQEPQIFFFLSAGTFRWGVHSRPGGQPARRGVFTAGRVASRLDVSPARQLAGLAAGEPAGSSQRAKKKRI